MSQLSDPELDKYLDRTRTETDPEKRQEAVNQAQQRVVEQAYIVPLYTPKTFLALSNSVNGALYSQTTSQLYLDDAYITK